MLSVIKLKIQDKCVNSSKKIVFSPVLHLRLEPDSVHLHAQVQQDPILPQGIHAGKEKNKYLKGFLKSTFRFLLEAQTYSREHL